MVSRNLPWKYSHLKNMMGYRKWEAMKSLKDKNQKRKLLDAYESGKKILFIHIPKTAGVSIIRTYDNYFAEARHSPALFYKLLLGRKYSKFATFALVRNPWSRLFSAYNFLIGGGLIDSDREMGWILSKQCPTFEHFIKEWLPDNDVCCYSHFIPQHEFVCGWGNDFIVEHIIKLERLEDSWHIIAAKLGLPALTIRRMNASPNVDCRFYYDNESIDIVHKLYKKDIELFNYFYDQDSPSQYLD